MLFIWINIIINMNCTFGLIFAILLILNQDVLFQRFIRRFFQWIYLNILITSTIRFSSIQLNQILLSRLWTQSRQFWKIFLGILRTCRQFIFFIQVSCGCIRASMSFQFSCRHIDRSHFFFILLHLISNRILFQSLLRVQVGF